MTMSRLKHGIICALQEETGSIICFRYGNLDIFPLDKILNLSSTVQKFETNVRSSVLKIGRCIH